MVPTGMPYPTNRGLTFSNGELLPKVGVRDENGKLDHLRATLEGRPSVIIQLPRPSSARSKKLARSLAELQLDIPGLQRVVLLPTGTDGSEVLALARMGLHTLTPASEREFDVGSEQQRCIVTDTAGRILGHHLLQGKQAVPLIEAVRRAFSTNDYSNDDARSRTAPVLMIPNVLDKIQCKRLIEHFEQNESHPSGVLDLSGAEPVWKEDAEVKSRQDFYITDSAVTREIEQAMAERVLPELRKCFHYVVTHHEQFKLVRYDADSGYFRPHRDNESADTKYRRFAMTLNLDSGAHDGGALCFPEFGRATYRPTTGSAIVFSCSLLHEALDVTRGQRHVLLGFFYNPSDGLTS